MAMQRQHGKRTVGAITIGQSPRTDMVPELLEVLGPGVELLEGGALDGMSGAEIAAIAPRDGDQVLVTRLRDGSSVRLAERHILPLRPWLHSVTMPCFGAALADVDLDVLSALVQTFVH
jgi:hypothetical protein